MMKDMPFILQQIGTWTALFLEVSFAFLAIIPRIRPWIWLALVGMHINIMLVVDFVDLTFGMIMIHLFTVDQRWIPAKKIKQPLIIYFDGVCSLCNGFVDSLIKEDSGRSLRYASLQSQAAIDAGVSIKDQTPTSVVVSDGDRVYTESDAVIRIAEGLGGVWRLMMVANVIPRSLRNAVYRTIAANRYRWFGKRETCRLPTAAERELFIG
jgi:predicted DCC family thiol-disulfide oxidoreductase YuxK